MDENTDKIQSQGGRARAAKLTAEQKKLIASKGALVRWGAEATHKGNFHKEFGIDVDCYVLDDVAKTAVISQSGMGKALGLSPRGNAFPRLLESKALAETVGAQLRDKIAQPIRFQWGAGGADQPPATVNGYDVTLLIEVCQAIVAAEDNLTPQQKHVAKQAHVILAASAKSGIKGLVYALAGYNPTTEEVIQAFKRYVQDEAKKYEKEFPPELYAEWQRLYDIPVLPRGRSWIFKKLTVQDIYFPLAKSSGKILQLIKANKANGGDRKTKLFQFLNETGTRALRFHLGRVYEMAESSQTKSDYERKIRARFGGEEQLELTISPPDQDGGAIIDDL